MQLAANGISIEVDDRGPPDGEPLLLIMGLGMQLVAWPEPLVDRLIEHGFRVIRIDNRDAGWSQGFDHLGVPNLAWVGMQHLLRLPVNAPYSLDDMAADAIGVLDALGIGRAHVVGASMGGMLAQLMALKWPARVRSISLMMTTPGGHGLPGPTARARAAMLKRAPSVRRLPGPGGSASRPDPADLESLVDHMVRLLAVIGSPGYPAAQADLRPRLARLLDRAWRPEGTVRQLAAIIAAPGRSQQLRGVRLPTQVIHGLEDPLMPIAHGRALAAAIPGARLHEIPGMGHDLPAALFETFANQIATMKTGERA